MLGVWHCVGRLSRVIGDPTWPLRIGLPPRRRLLVPIMLSATNFNQFGIADIAGLLSGCCGSSLRLPCSGSMYYKYK